jgi:putative intracellular protease/amidase
VAHTRVVNVPAKALRVFQLLGAHDELRCRMGHDVAIASYHGVDVVCADRITELFAEANREGCAYNVTTVRFEPSTWVVEPAQQGWRCFIVPPLDRWLGLSAASPLVRWVNRIASSSRQVIGVGTGMFVLAADGELDDRRVAAARPLDLWLSATAPRAIICDSRSVTDGPISTAVDPDSAIHLCTSTVGIDYGAHVERRLEVRLCR